jgi:hypothetical protein
MGIPMRVGWRPYVNTTPSLVTSGLILNLDASNTSSYSGTGTTWTDLSGNSLNATLSNGPTYRTSNSGYFQFDGINDAASISYNTLLDPANTFRDEPFTISGWVKFNGANGGTFINKGDNGNASIETYTVDIRPNGLSLTLWSDSNNVVTIRTSGLTLNSGTWYHFSINYTGDTGNTIYQTSYTGTTKLYIDSVEYSTTVTMTGTYPKMHVQNSPIFIGSFGQVGSANSYWATAFNGSIAQILMYNRQLTSTEVLQNYNSTKSKFKSNLIIDTYSTGAAYSLRKLNSAYSGPAITVRRSSDNTSQNIGFKADGTLDTTTLLSFVGAGNGFVTAWYDQSGQGKVSTQATAANQPQIVSNGSVMTINGKPSIYFGGSQLLQTASSVLSTGAARYSIYGVSYNVATHASTLMYVGSPTEHNGIGISANFSKPRHFWFANDYDTTQTFVHSQTYFAIEYDGTKRYTTVNNTTLSANATSKNTTNPILTIGKLSTMGQLYTGHLQELVLFDSYNTSQDTTSIKSNINSFYSIY